MLSSNEETQNEICSFCIKSELKITENENVETTSLQHHSSFSTEYSTVDNGPPQFMLENSSEKTQDFSKISSSEINKNYTIDRNFVTTNMNNPPTQNLKLSEHDSFESTDLNSFKINIAKIPEKPSRTPTSRSKKKEKSESHIQDSFSANVPLQEYFDSSTDQNSSPIKTGHSSLPRKGKNRKRRTKYDLAFKQLEELGDFFKECKSIDLEKFDSGLFAYEIISNPLKYTHEIWQPSSNIRLGADGRRLLLRKLRAVHSTNPKLWQDILQKNDFGDVRNIFTVATVPVLLRIAHLMGPDVWNFALKCACFTYKCPTLSMKDTEDCSECEGSILLYDSISDYSPMKGTNATRTPRKNYHFEKDNQCSEKSPSKSIKRRRKTVPKLYESEKPELNTSLNTAADRPAESPITHRLDIPEYFKMNSDTHTKEELMNDSVLETDKHNSTLTASEENFHLKNGTIYNSKTLYEKQSRSHKRKKPTHIDSHQPHEIRSPSLLTQSPPSFNRLELTTDENRDYHEYLKRIKIANEEYKLDLAYEGFFDVAQSFFTSVEDRNDENQRIFDFNYTPSSQNEDYINLNNATTNNSHSLSKFDNSNKNLRSQCFSIPFEKATQSPTQSHSSDTHLTRDSYDCEYPPNINFEELNDTTGPETTPNNGKRIADQCIFVQFMHCITLLDLTRKIIHSMKGRYTSQKDSNCLRNDTFNSIKDDDNSRLKLLTELSGNQIESLIKMNDLLYKSHIAIPSLSKDDDSYSLRIHQGHFTRNHNYTETKSRASSTSQWNFV